MIKLLVAIIISLCLSGCATPIFTKPGLTQEQWNKDYYECKQQAGAGSMNNIFIARDLEFQCLEARGYTRQK